MKRTILTALVCFLVVFIGGIAFVISTETGLRWTYNIVRDFLPAEFSAGEVRGRLIGPLRIFDVGYKTDALTVTVDSFGLDWRPSALLFLKLDLAKVDISGIDIKISESKASPEQPQKEEGGLPDISLPINIKVDDLLISDISIIQSGSTDAFIINKITLKAALDKAGLIVKKLYVTSPLFDVSLNGKVKPRGNYPLNLNTDWNVRPEGLSPVSGNGTFSGDLEKLKIKQAVNPPYNIGLKGSLRDVIKDLIWDMALNIKDLDLNGINTVWPEATVTANAAGSGSVSSFNIDGDIDLIEKQYGKLQGTFLLEKTDVDLLVKEVVLSVPGTDARIELSGGFSQNKGKSSFHSKGNWKSLAWPLRGSSPSAFSKNGNFEIKGSPDNYAFKIDTDLSGQQIPQSDINLLGKGNGSGIDDLSVSIKLLDGELNTKGSFAWKPETKWKVIMQGRSLNPGVQWPDWPGRLNMSASAEGSIGDGKQKIKVEGLKINGAIHDLPVKVGIVFEMKDTVFDLPECDIVLGSSKLNASGSYSDVWDAKWSVNVPALGEILKNAKGELSGEGALSGSSTIPSVKSHLSGSGITVDTNSIEKIMADMNIDGADREQSDIEISAEGVNAGTYNIEQVVLKAKGKLNSHNIELSTSSDQQSISLSVDAGLDNNTWKGRFTGGELDFADYGKWSLGKAEEFSISSKNVSTGDLCFQNNEASACLEAVWDEKDGLKGKAGFLKIPLSILDKKMPPGISIKGQLTADAEVASSGDIMHGRININIPSGAMNHKSENEDQLTIPFEHVNVAGSLDEDGLYLKAELSLKERGRLDSDIRLPGFSLPVTAMDKQPVSGHLTTELRIFELIPVFFPAVKESAGTAKAGLEISGTAGKPAVSGTVQLDKSHVLIPDYGLALDDINVDIKADKNGRVDIKAGLLSGEGKLNTAGYLVWADSADLEADLVVKGKDFQAVRIPGMWVVISPDMRLKIQQRNINVKGELLIPEASIEPPDLSGAVTPSKDVIVVSSDTKEKHEEKWKIESDLKLMLGDNVRFNSFGLTGRIEGDLHIKEEPGKAINARGEFEVLEGRYKAYGQELTIEKGRLIFVGLIDDPGLDINASRKIKDVTAGVRVNGTLRSPEMNVYSVPYMDQSDALSYLLFGRPMNGLSKSEGNRLHSAATSAGLSGGSIIAKKIGAKFGIEDVEIEQGETTSESSLFIGKYLSPKLYVSYGIGLFEPVNTIRMRYILNPKWLFQTEYGIESSGDLLYQIEK